MNQIEIKRKRIIQIVYYAILIIGFYLFMNYGFWLCYPFIFAFAIAALLQKPVRFLSDKTPMKRGLSSAICVFVLLFVIGSLLYLVGFRLFSELKDFFAFIGNKLQNLPKLVDDFEAWTNTKLLLLPDSLQNAVSSAINSFFDSISKMISADTDSAVAAAESADIPSGLSGFTKSFNFSWLSTPLSGVISTASKIPSILIGIVVTIVASCFLTADYERFSKFLNHQFSEERRNNFARGKQILKESLSKMGKAYAIIIFITFIEMSVGLSILKVTHIYQSGYIFVISLVTAVVDILPVLGTGTILVPWALFSLITGKVGLCIGLFVIYAVISVIRQIIEPKLVAGQLGLSPVLTLMSLFLGLKLFGVLGMFILPVSVVMIKVLNDEGILHLWKPFTDPEEKDSQPSGVQKVITKISEKTKPEKAQNKKR